MPALRELHFDEARLPFRVVRGQVVTDSVRFSGASCGDWRVAGAVGFDGRLDYAVSATLPREIAERLGARAALAAGALGDDQGRLLLDLHVGGTAHEPRVSWNTQAMRDRLEGRASQALREQSQKIGADLTRTLLGAPPESARTGAPPKPPDARELREKAGDVLRGLLGGKKPGAPAESAGKDTTRK